MAFPPMRLAIIRLSKWPIKNMSPKGRIQVVRKFISADSLWGITFPKVTPAL